MNYSNFHDNMSVAWLLYIFTELELAHEIANKFDFEFTLRIIVA